MRLASQQYGKERVRVMKVIRDGDLHIVKELTVSVSLQGDFETSYTAGDNSKVVATDTMKNTVQALALENLGIETERFLAFLGHHFLNKYTQISQVTISAMERVWNRMKVGEIPHPHTFSATDSANPTFKVIVNAEGQTVTSGIADLLILKSTQAGFVGYPRCEFTTLPETTDRVLATSLASTWNWAVEPDDYAAANKKILEVMLEVFASNYSPSAQTTLFEMATAALNVCSEIDKIHIAMPNKHYLHIPMEKFGLDNKNQVFLPTDEPHGQIEATVERDPS